MIKIGDKEYRNLQEQVGYNANMINNVIGNLDINIKILGKVNSVSELPPASDLNPGDCYAVVIADSDQPTVYCVGQPINSQVSNYWFKLGKLIGPQGEPGSQGPQGPQGLQGTLIYTGEDYPQSDIGIDDDLYIETSTGDLLKKINGIWTPLGTFKGPQGDVGPAASVIEIEGIVPVIEQLPTPEKEMAYLVGGTDTGYDLYITILNKETELYEWNNIGPFNDIVGRDGQSSIILNGANDPQEGQGTNLDYYINTSNGNLYSKSSGAWSQISNIKGPKGDAGQDSYIPSESAFKQKILDIVYPVNSIYMTATNTNPSTILGGGTWTLLNRDGVIVTSKTVLANGYSFSYNAYEQFQSNPVLKINLLSQLPSTTSTTFKSLTLENNGSITCYVRKRTA